MNGFCLHIALQLYINVLIINIQRQSHELVKMSSSVVMLSPRVEPPHKHGRHAVPTNQMCCNKNTQYGKCCLRL